MEFCAYILTENFHAEIILPYSIPITLITNGILHANNSRDIE